MVYVAFRLVVHLPACWDPCRPGEMHCKVKCSVGSEMCHCATAIGLENVTWIFANRGWKPLREQCPGLERCSCRPSTQNPT